MKIFKKILLNKKSARRTLQYEQSDNSSNFGINRFSNVIFMKISELVLMAKFTRLFFFSLGRADSSTTLRRNCVEHNTANRPRKRKMLLQSKNLPNKPQIKLGILSVSSIMY